MHEGFLRPPSSFEAGIADLDRIATCRAVRLVKFVELSLERTAAVVKRLLLVRERMNSVQQLLTLRPKLAEPTLEHAEPSSVLGLLMLGVDRELGPRGHDWATAMDGQIASPSPWECSGNGILPFDAGCAKLGSTEAEVREGLRGQRHRC